MSEGLKVTLGKAKKSFPAKPVGDPRVRCQSGRASRATPGGGGGTSSTPRRRSPLQSATVRAAMRRAWSDSQANDANRRHEEGGYIVRNANGSYGVLRWPRGQGALIPVPPRASDGTYRGRTVLGEFHTHPNPNVDEHGQHWREGPSPGDITGIRAEHYPGNSYVIGHQNVYRVSNAGRVGLVGPRGRVLRR